MVTYAWDGMPLPVEHGYPLRIYIPDRYGMKQPKWIQDIEAISSWEPGTGFGAAGIGRTSKRRQ